MNNTDRWFYYVLFTVQWKKKNKTNYHVIILMPVVEVFLLLLLFACPVFQAVQANGKQ